MDIALVITILFFVAAFIAAGLVIQGTTIRTLKEKIREMDEEMGDNYSRAAEADRDLRQRSVFDPIGITGQDHEELVAEAVEFVDRDGHRPHTTAEPRGWSRSPQPRDRE